MVDTYIWDIDAAPSMEDEIAVNSVSFGDGYRQVSSFGINNVRQKLQLKTTGSKQTIEAARSFLLSKKGVDAFKIDLCGDIGLYQTDGGINRQQISGDVWSISFSVIQVFIP